MNHTYTQDADRAQLLYWERNLGDRRDEASSVGSALVPKKDALMIARAWEAGDTLNDYATPAHLTPGHGITIIYRSGRRREVR